MILLDAAAAGAYGQAVILQRTEKLLNWGSLDAAMLGLVTDIAGQSVTPPAGYALVADPARLWFLAARAAPARIHPHARPGGFLAGLWEYDVAELFLAHPGGRYLEFNLAANGAWWSCEFSAPRVRAEPDDIAFPEVATFADLAPDGGWLAAMAIPLDVLRARIDFGPQTLANVSWIIESPNQRYLSACPLGAGPADFHQPGKFLPLRDEWISPGAGLP